MSGLEMITWGLGSQLEWLSCCKIGRKPRRINMGRPVTTNQNIFFFICSIGGWDGMQGGTSCTCHFESTHGRETGKTHFTRHRLV